MNDTDKEVHSGASNEAAVHPKATTICEAFSSSAGNVFFKSSDDVVFRIEDYYLKANSGLFRDMLSDSVSSTGLDNPLPVDESSQDFENLLLIVVGRGVEASKRVTTWKQAETLYRMANKYQIDSQRPWFSRMCTEHAAEKPWDALFLACNTSPMDTDIIRQAITEGLGNLSNTERADPRYFKEMRSTEDGRRCGSSIQINNITTLFGLKLGLLGLLAYRHTFDTIHTISTGGKGKAWETWASDFIKNVKKVEEERVSEATATE